jgi:hypothetical protein
MSGSSSVWVQPCTLGSAGQGLKPGFPDGTQTSTGLASPKDVLSLSPPSLLELYEVYAVSIAWGLQFNAPNDGAQVIATLRLLISGQLAWSSSDRETTVGSVVNGEWIADLVNPLRVGARERLSLDVLLSGNVAAPGLLMIAAQPLGTAPSNLRANWTPVESTISYNVVDLPASRRL